MDDGDFSVVLGKWEAAAREGLPPAGIALRLGWLWRFGSEVTPNPTAHVCHAAVSLIADGWVRRDDLAALWRYDAETVVNAIVERVKVIRTHPLDVAADAKPRFASELAKALPLLRDVWRRPKTREIEKIIKDCSPIKQRCPAFPDVVASLSKQLASMLRTGGLGDALAEIEAALVNGTLEEKDKRLRKAKRAVAAVAGPATTFPQVEAAARQPMSASDTAEVDPDAQVA